MKWVLVIILAVVLFVLVFILLGDLGWCVENYAPGDIGRCMVYENNIFGRYIHP